MLAAAGDDLERFDRSLSGSLALNSLVPPDGDPVAWTDPLAWTPALDSWVVAAAGRELCLDAFIAHIAGLPATEQSTFGLSRVSRLARADMQRASSQSGRLSIWLVAIREAAAATGLLNDWQRLVDELVVAGNPELARFSE